MVELEYYGNPEVFKKVNSIPVRTIVETQFYGNNVIKVGSVEEAYELARYADRDPDAAVLEKLRRDVRA